MTTPLLYEKYRPHTFDDVIGQDKAVTTIKRILDRERWGGQAFWISGPSGTGKTTLARIIAEMGADDFCVEEYDSADRLTAEEVDKLDREIGMYGWGKGGRAIIINEAHALRGPIIRRLLGLLERIPSHVVWCFTTTAEGLDKLFDDQIDASPLLSRCHEIRLTGQGLCKLFAARAQQIAQAEGLDGKPANYYETLFKENKNNFRRSLMAIADGRMMD